MSQQKPRASGSKASSARRAVKVRKAVAERKGKVAVGEDPALGKLERFTVNLPHGLIEETRDAAVALSGPPHFLTLSAFTRAAFRRELDRLRKQAGKGRQFPRRARPLRRGRPIGS